MDTSYMAKAGRWALAMALSLASICASAQTYDQDISEVPGRAAGVYHCYEYSPTALTKAPKGYKPFYISHYGRHGSRYHSSSYLVEYSLEKLAAADSAGLLTEEGKLLKRRIDTLAREHSGLYGMLTERGAKEHREIAARMYSNYQRVFSGKDGRNEIECVSSYWPRCLVSMANCTSVLLSKNENLKMHYLTGPKYLDYISMNLNTSPISKDSKPRLEKLRDETVSTDRFISALFTDKEKALEVIGNPQKFMEMAFLAGSISECTDAKPGIFSHFTHDELVQEGQYRGARMYFSYGVNKEWGDLESSIAKPLLQDIVARADEACGKDSHRAADLRFGHDVGLLPLIGTLNIKGVEERWSFDEIYGHWFCHRMIPMGSNLQMIFYRNKENDILVKLVYNDRETTIPALQTKSGPFYRWEDLRTYMEKKISAIPDDYIVKDDGKKERTGVTGM